jgi:hypothetical protein
MSFKRLDIEDVTISAESVIQPAWTGQVAAISGFNISFPQVSSTSGRYYHNVYQTTASAVGAEVQFSVGYGNRKGSGSILFDSNIPGYSPSSTIYGQYRTLINGDENTDFSFGTSTPNSIGVISVNRSRFKEKLAVGSTTLILSGSTGRISLTDDSKVATTVSYVDAGRVFNLYSGSAGTINSTTITFGKIYPDIGVLILNLPAITGSTGITINEASNASSTANISALRGAINSFTLQSEETITSNYVFVRVRNSEYNYSTNPSIITGSGELRYDVMVNSPQAYITTVGLYNDNNDLLAVAKLSRPLLKDFTKEALVRIKLDY